MAGKVVKQLTGNGSGQSLADRVNAAKYSLAGSGLGKGVVKATTEEIVPPKKKHLDYLTNCTDEVNLSIPELAEYLIDRLQQTSAVVVMKTLITTHHLLNFGNEKFSQYMAAKDTSLYLPSFVDKSSPSGYEMSQYIKLYSKYVNEKTTTYRLMAFDLCKIKRGKDDGVLRRMPLEKLMKSLPILQGQINVLVDFDASAKELSNPVLLAVFTLMYKDLIRLFASYNEGFINLIEQYFTMSRKMCQEALKMYKSFLELTEKVLKFVTVAENAGVGDKASLGLQTVPPKVLQTLENHLSNLEKRKTSQSDSEDGKLPTNALSTLSLPTKTNKANKGNKVEKNHNENKTKIEDKKVNEDDSKVKHEDVKTKPERGKCPVQKPQESNSHDLLNDIFNNIPESDTSTSTPVRTQLRRLEEHHSVAVTVKRAGRSISPNRPLRSPHFGSRDLSPIANERNSTPVADKPDLFINLRDDSSDLTISPTTTGNNQASPFGCDKKSFGDYGSFWNSIVENNETKHKEVNFDAAFKKEIEDDEESLPEETNETNLLEIDLLGLNIDEKPAANQTASIHNISHGLADIDELLDLGCGSIGDTPLIPSAPTPIVSKTSSDNFMDSISYVSKTNIKSSIPPKEPINAVNKCTTPAKIADTNISDTLAFLAGSLGKGENKWYSNVKQKQTLSGYTIDVIGLSSGPTIDWSKSTATSSSSVTKTESTANNNDLLDLLG